MTDQQDPQPQEPDLDQLADKARRLIDKLDQPLPPAVDWRHAQKPVQGYQERLQADLQRLMDMKDSARLQDGSIVLSLSDQEREALTKALDILAGLDQHLKTGLKDEEAQALAHVRDRL